MKEPVYYLTSSHRIVELVRREGATYIVRLPNGQESRIFADRLTLIPAEKLQWFSTQRHR